MAYNDKQEEKYSIDRSRVMAKVHFTIVIWSVFYVLDGN